MVKGTFDWKHWSHIHIPCHRLALCMASLGFFSPIQESSVGAHPLDHSIQENTFSGLSDIPASHFPGPRSFLPGSTTVATDSSRKNRTQPMTGLILSDTTREPKTPGGPTALPTSSENMPVSPTPQQPVSRQQLSKPRLGQRTHNPGLLQNCHRTVYPRHPHEDQECPPPPRSVGDSSFRKD